MSTGVLQVSNASQTTELVAFDLSTRFSSLNLRIANATVFTLPEISLGDWLDLFQTVLFWVSAELQFMSSYWATYV